jgi:hypothetical protein
MFLRRLPLAQSGGLSTEMMMHFNGLKHVDRPAILAFPNIVVCLDCGASRFTTPVKALGCYERLRSRY